MRSARLLCVITGLDFTTRTRKEDGSGLTTPQWTSQNGIEANQTTGVVMSIALKSATMEVTGMTLIVIIVYLSFA